MPAKRKLVAQRGVTLIEVLIVVAIMSLLASGVALAAYKHYQDVKIRTAQTATRELRQAVHAYWLDRTTPNCPSIG